MTEGQEFVLTVGYHNNDASNRWIGAEPEVPEDIRNSLVQAVAEEDSMACRIKSNKYRTTIDFPEIGPHVPNETLLHRVADVFKKAGHIAVREIEVSGAVVKEPL